MATFSRLPSAKVVIGLSLLAAILFRLPSLFEPYWYVDEGVYLTGGELIRKGLTLYRDLNDNKPPLIYFSAALTPTQFWWHLLGIGLSFLTCLLFYRIAWLLLKNKTAALLATLGLACLWSLPFLEGHTVNAEHFFVPLGLAGLLLALKKTEHPRRDLILAGLFFGLGFLYKFQSVSDPLALVIFWWLLREPNLSLSHLINVTKNCLYLAVGFVFPVIISGLYFAIRGSLSGYWFAAFAGNLDYAVRWNPEIPSYLVWLGLETLKGRLLVFALLLSLLFLLRKSLSVTVRFLAVWFMTSLFSALLSGRGYPHYLLPVIPPFLLLLSLIAIGAWREKLLPLVAGGLLLSSILLYNFYFYPSTAYYRNFFAYASGKTDWLSFAQSNHGWTVGRNLQIAAEIQKRTAPLDRIFIWADQPHLYALVDRVPASPYLFIFQIQDLKKEAETLTGLENKPPKIIVTFADEPRVLNGLESLLTAKYQLLTTINNAQLYQLIPAQD